MISQHTASAPWHWPKTLALILLATAWLSCTRQASSPDSFNSPGDPLHIEISQDLVKVSFINNGDDPLGEPWLVFACDYAIDGLEAQVQTLVATSCLGGCYAIEPGDLARFDFPLRQLRLTEAPEKPIPEGVHAVTISCPETPPATLQVEFPKFSASWWSEEPSA